MISASKSGRLVVGGGRAPAFPLLGTADISLNIDPVARPDVLGDIASSPFKSASFNEVYFERVPFTSFTGRKIGALSESARVLLPGDRLMIETGIAAPIGEMMAGLRAAGFANVTVDSLGLLRMTAVLGGP